MSKLSWLNKLINNNNLLASVLKDNDITNLKLINLKQVTSKNIALTRISQNLLLKNNTLEEILKVHNIKLEREYLEISPKKESANYPYSSNYDSESLSSDIIDNFELELILSNYHSTESTIVIYNAINNTFSIGNKKLNNFLEKNSYGIDILEEILKYIQSLNRITSSNIQVYICGIPNILELNNNTTINHKLKNITTRYANTVYVEPAKKIFTPYISEEAYYEKEDLSLNNNIIEAINNNYLITKNLIITDRELSKINKKNYDYDYCSDIKEEFLNQKIFNIILARLLKMPTSYQKEFIKRLVNYLNENIYSDFSYLNKNIIKRVASYKKIKIVK